MPDSTGLSLGSSSVASSGCPGPRIHLRGRQTQSTSLTQDLPMPHTVSVKQGVSQKHILSGRMCVSWCLSRNWYKNIFFLAMTLDTCPILIFTFSSVIWYQNVSEKHLFELDGSFHYCTMALLWRFQSKDEWGWPQKVIFLACTHASSDFSRYTLYSSLSITQCKWQQWVVNLYFVASPANRRPYSMLVRMTCIYEPDDLTETRMELLAAVSTDSDLYLAKVGHHNVVAGQALPHKPINP